MHTRPLLTSSLAFALLTVTACAPAQDEDDTTAEDSAEDTDTATDDDTDSGSDSDSGADSGNDTGADTGTEPTSPLADCIERGENSNGTTWTAMYDSNGRVMTYVYVTSSLEGTVYYTWDAAGNLLAQEYDTSNDGTIDVAYLYAYDEENRLVQYEHYVNGTLSQRHETVYNTDGSTTHSQYNGSGTRTSRTETTYNEYGYPSYVAIDYSGDDIPEQIGSYVYTYDSEGRALEQGYDYGANGSIENQYSYTYDAAGNMITRRDTLPSDPSYYLSYTWTYEASGNLSLATYETSYGDAYEIAYRYDSDGRIVEQTRDNAPLGSIDQTVTWTYECP